MHKSDMRPGIKKAEKGETIHGFNPNPFKNGGAQEQADVSAGKMAKGPSLKNAPKPDRVDDAVDEGEERGNYAD